MNLRRVLPDSLGGWVFTVIVTAVILIYGLSLISFFVFRDESAAAAAASQAADQLIVYKRVIEQANPEERIALIRGLNSPGLRMVITPRPVVSESDEVFTSRIVYRRLEREFPDGTDIRIDSRFADPTADARFPTYEEIRRHHRDTRPPRPEGMEGPQRPPSSLAAERRARTIDQTLRDIRGFQPFVRASVQVGDNTWFNARVDLNLSESGERVRPFLITTALTLAIAGMAVWAVRRATRPVTLFATAAERLGIELNAAPLPETGTGEVRRAARTFNTMQSRLKRFVQDRTQMLAAISHDLRTPITRMRLRAEFVDDDEQRNKMLADLNEMEAMIKATMEFARDDAANEAAEVVDIAAGLNALVADGKAIGHDVRYEGPTSLSLTARPLGLKRALTNLVENAVKYGGSAEISLRRDGDYAEILVDDSGPGIPDAEKDQVFTPFYRLESSRSRDTGGTGLGMTIARNAIRSMGGDVVLRDRPGGGLRVKVTLPIQA